MKRTLPLLLAAFAAPCFAQDLRPVEPSIMYYFSVPFGGESRRDHEPVVGFAFQGKRVNQSFRMDTRLMNLIGTGVFEAKYLIIGAVAAGAAVAAGSKDKSVSTQQQQQAAAQEQIAAGGTVPECQVKACFMLRPYNRF
jgi:hypothetical protein